MSLVLSAQTGTVVTPAQLLGTEAEEKASRTKAAEKNLKKLLKKFRKRPVDAGGGVYEEYDPGGGDVIQQKRLKRG